MKWWICCWLCQIQKGQSAKWIEELLWLCQVQKGQSVKWNDECVVGCVKPWRPAFWKEELLLAASPNGQPVWMKLASYKIIGLPNERQDRPPDYLKSLLGRSEDVLGLSRPIKEMYRCAGPEQARHWIVSIAGLQQPEALPIQSNQIHREKIY